MKFTINKLIGRGGFGRVEQALGDDGCEYAIKTFDPASYIPAAAHEKLKKRFKREVHTQIELAAPSIMPVIESNLTCDEPWFAMPLADSTYEEQIAIDRSSGEVDVDAISDILNGLEYIHELGYVHRDLNPKNILKVNGSWVLSDFGAVLPPTGHTVTLTEGTSIYTEQYCAPEQRGDFHNAQPSADIFSLGCVLHDIFGFGTRTPYSKATADGSIGIIIEKCTEPKPEKRPAVQRLRGLLIEQLLEMGGKCVVDDKESQSWLDKIDKIDEWGDKEFDEFAAFFAQLDVKEKNPGYEEDYVYSLSSPFLTRLPAEVLVRIAKRGDGIADAIIEKYCEWAKSTSFLFEFSDTVCSRLCAIFDNGDPVQQAMAMASLLKIGSTHNRWHVMRNALRRCVSESTDDKLAKRLYIEIKTEEVEFHFNQCVEVMHWDVEDLSTELRKLL